MDFDNGMLVSCAENYNIQQGILYIDILLLK